MEKKTKQNTKNKQTSKDFIQCLFLTKYTVLFRTHIQNLHKNMNNLIITKRNLQTSIMEFYYTTEQH